jgi:hypothetical protein
LIFFILKKLQDSQIETRHSGDQYDGDISLSDDILENKWNIYSQYVDSRSKRSKEINDFYEYMKRHSSNFHGRPAIPFRIGKRFKQLDT